jgi:hypothetical protein
MSEAYNQTSMEKQVLELLKGGNRIMLNRQEERIEVHDEINLVAYFKAITKKAITDMY